MNFEEIIDEFRYFGGTFENLRLEKNTQSELGLFVINPSKKFKIFVPENLMISIDMLCLDSQQQIMVKEEFIWPDRKKRFFENYQKYFGWGRGGFDQTLKIQSTLRKLPNELIQILLLFGLSHDFVTELNPKFCLQKYFLSRKILSNGISKIMPIMELLNHSNDGYPFLIINGVKCTGFSKSEAFARYHNMIDGFDFFGIYNFAIDSRIALSCNTSINVPKIGKISINRTTIKKSKPKAFFSTKFTRDKTVDFYDVEIANTVDPSAPLDKFKKLCEKYNIKKEVSQTIFKGLLKHNMIILNNCLKMTADKDNKLINEIVKTSRNQLKIIQSQFEYHSLN
jgi:hypothetical protein|tara:strand:- start:724 stop:1740 length:1017 start_codon:yes stop_codon:yes gene_type:complete